MKAEIKDINEQGSGRIIFDFDAVGREEQTEKERMKDKEKRKTERERERQKTDRKMSE